MLYTELERDKYESFKGKNKSAGATMLNLQWKPGDKCKQALANRSHLWDLFVGFINGF